MPDPHNRDLPETEPLARPRPDDMIQPVVRRRLIRPEWLVLVIGIVFVVSAVAKPWGSTPTLEKGRAPKSSPAQIAVASPSAADSASPEPLDFMGVPGLAKAAPIGHGRTWADVSWRALDTTDQHSTLGLSTVSLTVVPYSGPYLPDPPAPKVAWTPSVGGAAATVVSIPPDTNVFAIAATWPKSLGVSGISIRYVVAAPLPYQPASSPVVPINASDVVLTSSVRASPSPSATAVRSGQFWVAPSAYAPDLDPDTLALVWQLGPWAWPTGEYHITLSTSNGPVVMRLVLEQGA
jgi:hypothetical protein